MSDNPIISLEELKTIIETVDIFDVKTVNVRAWEDEYIISKNGIEIGFGKVYGSNDKTNVTFKFNNSYHYMETYQISYNDLIQPLVHKFRDGQRKHILDTFGINNTE